MRWIFSFLFLTLLGVARALSTTGKKVLVVIEEASEKSRYSQFWSDLESRGYNIAFESPKNEKVALFEHGERAYDHVVLLPPKSKGLGPSFTPALLLKFLKSNGNILLTLSSTSPTPSSISALLVELGINLPSDRTSQVVDHFNYDELSASEKHDVILLSRPDALRPGVRNFFVSKGGDDPIVFPRGVGQVLENDNPLVAPVLRAPSTAYAYNPKAEEPSVEDPFATGQQLCLVSCIQARNSARITVLGSVEMLEDVWFKAQVKKASAKGARQQSVVNRDFAKEISAWTFMEIGVLKVGAIKHHLTTDAEKVLSNGTGLELEPSNSEIYRVKSNVTYSIELSEYVYDHLEPFVPPPQDSLQLEFTMLSPFHRLTLQPSISTDNSTIYSTQFTLPDQHGIFNFRVNYKRPFLTNVDEKRTVTVRHFAHDEWPRSWRISGAWTWIAGIWTTILAWMLFVALWLFSAPPRQTSAKKVQ